MGADKLEFSVDSQLLGELGERLVTRSYIALSELIKNAYDADATELTIRFINVKGGESKQGKGEIHLIDNGQGMTFGEVKDYWMRIATPYKIWEPISPVFGRKKTGSKGIGRFACRRLARKLILETVAKISGSKGLEHTKVEFDWDKFESGTTLTEIPCEYQRKKARKAETGLTLRLTNLTEAWTESEFNLLRRQVLILSIVKGIRRKGFQEDPGFEVIFDAPEFPKGAGILVDQFMDAGWGKLEGAVDKDGNINIKLAAKMIGTHHDRLAKKFETLKGVVQFEIAWVPMKREYLRDTSTLTKGLAQKVMAQQGGVRVYLDGFRIYPYGDANDDWLGIDKDVARRRTAADHILDSVASKLGTDAGRAMLAHPRNRSLIGRVYISSTTRMSFKVKTDREGFIRNRAYDELIQAIRLALQWMVLHYNRFLLLWAAEIVEEAERELRKELGGALEKELKGKAIATPLVQKAVDILSLEAKREHITLSEEEKKKLEERVDATGKFIQLSFARAEIYLNTLRVFASTGAFMFVFAHELKDLIARLDTHANTITRIMEKLPRTEKPEFTAFAQSLRRTRDRFDGQVTLFGIVAEKARDAHREGISVKRTCREVLDVFGYLIEHYDINEPLLDVPNSLTTGPMLEGDLFSIIVNLVSNAIKAILAGNGKNMLIQGRKEHGKTVIRVFDDGMELPEDFREEVFTPLTADPDERLYRGLRERIQDEDLAVLGRGSGLGLSIVRGIAEMYRGKAHFIDAEPPWKTCVEVVIP